MGLFSRMRDHRPVDLDERAPQTGVKYSDLLVLEQLLNAGADLTAPRHVVYYLYFPSEEGATAAAAESTAAGFGTDLRAPTPEADDLWVVVAERHDYVLDLDIVRDNTDWFAELAERHGGDYDGWEASVA